MLSLGSYQRSESKQEMHDSIHLFCTGEHSDWKPKRNYLAGIDRQKRNKSQLQTRLAAQTDATKRIN